MRWIATDRKKEGSMTALLDLVEEFDDVQDVPELKALWCFGEHEQNAYADPACVPLFKSTLARLRANQPTPVEQEEGEVQVDNAMLLKKLEELQAEVDRLKSSQPKPTVVRSSKRYKLLKFDVSWTTKRQVHVIAAILEAHAKVGDILDESEIIEMVEANVAALETRQGGKKVWKYYAGNSDDGLQTHGNIVQV
jgi:hypothetical protein